MLPPHTGSRLALSLLLAGSLVACTDDGAPQIAPSASTDPCAFDSTATVAPAECVPDPGAPSGPPVPATSEAIAPVDVPAAPEELGRATNADDPVLQAAELEVRVPAGGRLKSTVACNGAGTVKLVTVPKSGAMQEFRCEYGTQPVELTVEAATPLQQAQTYQVTFSAGAPARWAMVLSYVTGTPEAEPLGG